jgi:hypothetical protein
VIVLDALDECGTPQSRRPLLKVFTNEVKNLPSFFRIFITSRNEHDINLAFSGGANICPKEFQIGTDDNQVDIMSYLKHQLEDIRNENQLLSLGPDWPGEERIQALCRHSAGLFQWCSTAIKLIMQAHDPEDQVKRLVEAETYKTAEAALHALYKTALDVAGPWEDQNFQEDFQAIFGLILVAQQPLGHDMIDLLLGLQKRPALHTIQYFGSVLSCGPGQPVQILHPSFADFLSNKEYCKENYWFIDMAKQHFLMTERCFQIMKRELKFNICELATSHKLNDEIPDWMIKSSHSSHLHFNTHAAFGVII